MASATRSTRGYVGRSRDRLGGDVRGANSQALRHVSRFLRKQTRLCTCRNSPKAKRSRSTAGIHRLQARFRFHGHRTPSVEGGRKASRGTTQASDTPSGKSHCGGIGSRCLSVGRPRQRSDSGQGVGRLAAASGRDRALPRGSKAARPSPAMRVSAHAGNGPVAQPMASGSIAKPTLSSIPPLARSEWVERRHWVATVGKR